MSVSRPGVEARSVFRNIDSVVRQHVVQRIAVLAHRYDLELHVFEDQTLFAVGPEEEFAVTGTQDSLGAAGRGMRLGAVRIGVEQHEVGSCFGFPLEALHVHGVQPVAVAA